MSNSSPTKNHNNNINNNNNNNNNNSCNSSIKSQAIDAKTSSITNKKSKINDSKLDNLKSSCSSTNSSHGIFRRAIPKMPKPLAIVCCIMNIFLPGSGTLVAAFSILCCNTTHEYDKNIVAFLVNFIAFILQFCSSIIIFGWIWSIKYGLLFIHVSDQSSEEMNEPDLPLYVRRHSSVDTTMYQPIKPRVSISLNQVKEEELS